jgi:hypothetical protein
MRITIPHFPPPKMKACEAKRMNADVHTAKQIDTSRTSPLLYVLYCFFYYEVDFPSRTQRRTGFLFSTCCFFPPTSYPRPSVCLVRALLALSLLNRFLPRFSPKIMKSSPQKSSVLW